MAAGPGLPRILRRKDWKSRRLEYERDYDALTNLLNRRAFHRAMDELFTLKRDSLGYSALVMLDLDNLCLLYTSDSGRTRLRLDQQLYGLDLYLQQA